MSDNELDGHLRAIDGIAAVMRHAENSAAQHRAMVELAETRRAQCEETKQQLTMTETKLLLAEQQITNLQTAYDDVLDQLKTERTAHDRARTAWAAWSTAVHSIASVISDTASRVPVLQQEQAQAVTTLPQDAKNGSGAAQAKEPLPERFLAARHRLQATES